MRCDIKNYLLRHCHCSVYMGPLELARVRDENPVCKLSSIREGGDVTVATLLGFEAWVRPGGYVLGSSRPSLSVLDGYKRTRLQPCPKPR